MTNLPDSLQDRAIWPRTKAYESVRSTYFRGGSPGLVLQPQTSSEVVDAVAWARTNGHLPLSLRSGGHGVRGRSTNTDGLVIDLSRRNEIRVLDQSSRLVRIGPGARWMDVANALAPHGWAISSGDDGRVGVGGLATAGGAGLLGRAHGLTIDRLRAVEMVLANGDLVRASETNHPELFWAVRGAGAAFGVVTAFEFEAVPVKNVGWAQLVLDASDTAVFLANWGRVVEDSPRDLTSFLILSPSRVGQPTVAFVSALVNSEERCVIEERLRPLTGLAPLFDHKVQVLPYADLLSHGRAGDQHGQGEPVSRSASLKHLTPSFGSAAAELLRRGEVSFFQIRSMGGAIADIPVEATAFGSREANFEVTVAGLHRHRLDLQWDLLRPHFSGLFLTFDTDPRPGRLRDAFPARTLERLVHLKKQVDPTNLFRDNLDFSVLEEAEPRRGRPAVGNTQGEHW